MRDLTKNVLLLLLLAGVLFVFWGYVRATPTTQTHAQSPSVTATPTNMQPAGGIHRLIRVNQWM